MLKYIHTLCVLVGQYKCRQNFMKIAAFPSAHNGIKFGHYFAATGQFKHLHDGAGKDSKAFLTRLSKEMIALDNTTRKCFESCRAGHHANPTTPTPKAYHERKKGHFDRYFYRYGTTDRAEYSECVRSYNDPEPKHKRSTWGWKHQNKTGWAVFIDRQKKWDAQQLKIKVQSKHEFVGFHRTNPQSLKVKVLPCRCRVCDPLQFEVRGSADCLSVQSGFFDLSYNFSTVTTVYPKQVDTRRSTRAHIKQQQQKKDERLINTSKQLKKWLVLNNPNTITITLALPALPMTQTLYLALPI